MMTIIIIEVLMVHDDDDDDDDDDDNDDDVMPFYGYKIKLINFFDIKRTLCKNHFHYQLIYQTCTQYKTYLGTL